MSEQAKHTPGPWLASGDADANIVTVEAKDKGYTTVCRLGYSTPTREANARLIAAAPDLLEALVDMVSSVEVALEDVQVTNGASLDALSWIANSTEKARAAIAKARGE